MLQKINNSKYFVNEAIALWNEYKKGTVNGVPSIGILVHTPGENRTGRRASESGVWKDDRFGYDTILSVNQHRRGFVSWLKIRMLCLS